MIGVNKISVQGFDKLHNKRLVRVDLIADSSLEVEAIGKNATTIHGLSEHDELVFGSTCFTATMEFGILDSTGNWRFE